MFQLVAIFGMAIIAAFVAVSLIITFIFRYIINKISEKSMEIEKQHAAMILMGIAACAIVFVIAKPFAIIPLCVLGYQIIKLW